MPNSGECPSGLFEEPSDDLCDTPVCANNCAGHGSCIFSKYVYDQSTDIPLVGRPECTCTADWTADEREGCVPPLESTSSSSGMSEDSLSEPEPAPAAPKPNSVTVTGVGSASARNAAFALVSTALVSLTFV